MNHYEEESQKIAQIQREAGWSDDQIKLHAEIQKAMIEKLFGGDLPVNVHLGASLGGES
jgi:hypothetical protein